MSEHLNTQSLPVSEEAATHVIVIGFHHGTQEHLVYLVEGDIESAAVVEVGAPELDIYCPEDYLETGNALHWLTQEQLVAPGISHEYYRHAPAPAG